MPTGIRVSRVSPGDFCRAVNRAIVHDDEFVRPAGLFQHCLDSLDLVPDL